MGCDDFYWSGFYRSSESDWLDGLEYQYPWVIKMSDRQNLRLSILSQSNPFGSKQRFGLFSQPISTAIGDDGAFRVKIHPRDERGKPQTQPRNFYISPLKSGQLKSSYFGPLNTLANHQRKDIFMQQGVRLLKEQHQSFIINRKEANFYPIAGIKPISNSAYEFIEETNPELDPKRFKMEDGRVRSGPKNFYTNPQFKVRDTTFRHYKYIEDPYDRKHEKLLEDLRKSRAKNHEGPFSPNSFTADLFNNDKSVYGLDKEIALITRKQTEFNIIKHESPWSPASVTKQGLNGFFQPVIPYIENPPRQKKLDKTPKAEKQAFKGMGTLLSTPSPSISLNRVNMMKSLNRSRSPRR